MPALKAFRQFDGRASHDVALAFGIDPNHMAILESGELAASDAEIEALADVPRVPAIC